MSQIRQTGRFLRPWWPVVLALVVMAAVVGLVSLEWLIRASADDQARLAQREHPGDRVEALARYVEDERHSLHDRNRAVWALGQLRDARALPVLQKHYTGGKCQHDRFLCQSELKKAIDLCSGQRTAPRWLQRVEAWMFRRA
jgi:hypothetical protein